MTSETEKIIERYLNFYPPRPVEQKILESIETKLGINLPDDFIAISKVFDGYYSMGSVTLFSFDDEDWSITSETLRLREEANLPHQYVILYDEVGMVLMQTQDSSSIPTPIFDCSYQDVANLIDGKPCVEEHTRYDSFAEYFEQLVSQEEEDRDE